MTHYYYLYSDYTCYVYLYYTILQYYTTPAANCYNLFDPAGSFATTGVLPEGYVGLTLVPLFLQLIPLLIETAVARDRGIKLSFIQLPGWFSLPTFGYRTTYLNMPKTRNGKLLAYFVILVYYCIHASTCMYILYIMCVQVMRGLLSYFILVRSMYIY